MKPGKVSNAILKRSVLKQIKKREKYASKPAIGIDCAYIKTESNKEPVIVSAVSGDNAYPVYRAANNILSSGGIPVAAQVNIIVPLNAEESVIRLIMEDLEKQCAMYDIQISGGHTQASCKVNEPVVNVTVIGKYENTAGSYKGIKPGQDIIMTKWAGISGIRQIIDKNRDEILKFYRPQVLEKAYGNVDDLSVIKELECVKLYNTTNNQINGVKAIHDISEGGVYAALWDMAEAGKVGIDIDFKNISVNQEIIEICEIFDVNPYELESVGALLMTADKSSGIIELLNSNGIKAAVIGRTTDSNDKIIRNGDEMRYLDAPKQDEVYRFV